MGYTNAPIAADKAPTAITEPTPTPAPPEPASGPADRLTLVGATALVVGSIVGVGIFNLPSSLAPYGADHARLDGVDDDWGAYLAEAVRVVVTTDATRTHVWHRQRAGIRERVVLLDYRLGVMWRSSPAGCSRSRSSSTSARRGSGRFCWHWSASGSSRSSISPA